MKTVFTVIPTGLAPHAGPIPPWMNMTAASLPLEDTVPEITTVKGPLFPSVGTTTSVMAMDVALHLVPGWRTTHPHAAPTRILMMPGLLPLRVIMMTLTSLRGPMDVLARHLELTMLRMIGPDTGKWPLCLPLDVR